jgi:hypothetical protein
MVRMARGSTVSGTETFRLEVDRTHGIGTIIIERPPLNALDLASWGSISTAVSVAEVLRLIFALRIGRSLPSTRAYRRNRRGLQSPARQLGRRLLRRGRGGLRAARLRASLRPSQGRTR